VVKPDRYPTPEFRRLALAPAIVTAIILLATVALVDTDAYLIVRFAVCILALVIAVFVWQSRAFLWLVAVAPIAVLWNPIVAIELPHDAWLGAHYITALLLILVGIFVKVRNVDDRNTRS
jgi:hypothetical protein